METTPPLSDSDVEDGEVSESDVEEGIQIFLDLSEVEEILTDRFDWKSFIADTTSYLRSPDFAAQPSGKQLKRKRVKFE